MERLVREVRSALHRRKREETQARRAVEQQLRSEMCESLTSMLLSCELAMSVPGVPGPAAEKYEPSTIWPAKCASGSERTDRSLQWLQPP
jgi:hypothetical protein